MRILSKPTNHLASEVISTCVDIRQIISLYRSQKWSLENVHTSVLYKNYSSEEKQSEIEWYQKTLQAAKNKLQIFDQYVDELDYWDDTIYTPIAGLSYKKDSETKDFISVEDNFSLERDLQDSNEVKEFVKDDNKAQNLYAALCNNEFEKDFIADSVSWRGAGRIVASLRELGESYLDFYCSGIISDCNHSIKEHYVPEGFLTGEVRILLTNINWYLRR